MTEIGIIGLGRMGSAVASTLMANRAPLLLWNRTRARAERIAGAKIAASALEVFTRCRLVLLMVFDHSAAEDLLNAHRDRLGRRCIAMRTDVAPRESTALGALVAQAGGSYVEAQIYATADEVAARRAWVLRMAGLEHHHDQLTAELSLGWKQRLALGSAVLHEPPILFLDEPTSGVDPVSRRNFWELIYSLADGGTTVLVSTHYMEEAEYCHRLALMNRGRLIALDTPARVKGLMQEPLLEIVTADGPGVAQALQGQPGVSEAAMFGRAVHVTVENAETAAASLPAFLASRRLPVERIHAIAPSLEDVFVALVRREGGAVAG